MDESPKTALPTFDELGVYGWTPAQQSMMWAAVLSGRNIALFGKHGIAKSMLARKICQSLGWQFRYYDAPKTELTQVAGIPNPSKLAQGVFEWVGHGSAVWGADLIFIDELSRGARDVQNLFLEIMQERSLQNQPLSVKTVLATLNPEEYRASFELDAALKDRFDFIFEPPVRLELKSEMFGSASREVTAMPDYPFKHFIPSPKLRKFFADDLNSLWGSVPTTQYASPRRMFKVYQALCDAVLAANILLEWSRYSSAVDAIKATFEVAIRTSFVPFAADVSVPWRDELAEMVAAELAGHDLHFVNYTRLSLAQKVAYLTGDDEPEVAATRAREVLATLTDNDLKAPQFREIAAELDEKAVQDFCAKYQEFQDEIVVLATRLMLSGWSSPNESAITAGTHGGLKSLRKGGGQ